jgi:sugar diacid utilization regulator
MRANGVVGRVAASEDVVAVACEDMRPRRAIGIRAGGLVVGYIWAAEGATPLSRHADAALREAARLAAPLLLRRRAVTDLERHVRADLLRSLLCGRGAADSLAGELGLAPGARYTVVAYELECADRDQAALVEGRTVDFVSMFFRSYRREALVVAGEDGRVHALLRCAEEQGREAFAAVVQESVASMRQALKLRLRAGLGTTVEAFERIAVSCREAEQALRVGDDGGHGAVVDIEDVRGESFVLELAEHVAGRPCPLAKPLTRLYEHDRLYGTDYVETLTVYLDCFGNTTLAAERLHIHPNTLRYRVRRLTELAGVDLEQPVQRFALEAQLRLLGLAGEQRR